MALNCECCQTKIRKSYNEVNVCPLCYDEFIAEPEGVLV
jgi:Zn finger protein HypA/HybF involved in hydrogenase expression